MPMMKTFGHVPGVDTLQKKRKKKKNLKGRVEMMKNPGIHVLYTFFVDLKNLTHWVL